MLARQPFADLRQSVRSLGTRNPWVIQPGRRPVPLAELVSPLRYDIVVRARWFELLAAHEALFDADFPAFLALSREHDYYQWFVRLFCVHFAPHLLDDPPALERAFAVRVGTSAELYRSFVHEGYRSRSPITLQTARRILPTATGKRLARRLYAGDGCHRIALLMLAGRAVLEPWEYRVRHYVHLAPLDGTSVLLGPVGVSPAEYLAFVAQGYSVGVPAGEESLLSDVARRDPAAACELRAIIAIDRRRLEGAAR